MAKKLTSPQFDHVIEPFAGSACYSLYHNPRKVTLIDADPVLAGLWQYLIKATPKEIMALPVDVNTVDEIRACQEAKWLIGFWFNCGTAQPSKRRSNWGSLHQFRRGVQVWSEGTRRRIAQQVPLIKHWKVIHGNWYDAPDTEAHWHVDPPYCGTKAGKAYKFHDVDYQALAKWCLKRKGFLQVCEAGGADWLPFAPSFSPTKGTLRSAKAAPGTKQYSTEAVFEVGRRKWSLIEPNDSVEAKDNDDSRRNRTGQGDRRQAGKKPPIVSRKDRAGGKRVRQGGVRKAK